MTQLPLPFTLPTTGMPDISSALSSVKLPGTDLSAAQSAITNGLASAQAALPSPATLLAQFTPGGGTLPNISGQVTTALAALDKAPIAIPNLDIIKTQITGTITSFQANIGTYSAAVKAKIEEAAKTATEAGAALPNPNTIASDSIAKLMAPLTEGVTAVQAAVTKVMTNLKAAAVPQLGGLGEPLAQGLNAAATLQNGLSSQMAKVASEVQAITAPLKAQLLAAASSGPLAQLPAMRTMFTSLGVPMNISATGTPTANAFTLHKSANSAVETPPVLPPDPIKPYAVALGSDNTVVQTPNPVASQVLDAEIAKLKSNLDAAIDDYLKLIKSGLTHSTATTATTQAAYDSYMNSLLTPQQIEAKTKASAILRTKPDQSTLTDSEKVIVNSAQDSLGSNSKYEAVRGAQENVHIYETAYKQAYAMWVAKGNKYDLPIGVRSLMSGTYVPLYG